MKPKWKDAPKDAKYRAMDENGSWAWFKKKPVKYCGEWLPQSYLDKKVKVLNKNWEQTLEERPKNEP